MEDSGRSQVPEGPDAELVYTDYSSHFVEDDADELLRKCIEHLHNTVDITNKAYQFSFYEDSNTAVVGQ